MEEKDKLASWDSFTGSFVKAVDVKSEEDAYVVTQVEVHEEKGQVTPRLTLERNEIAKQFDLNKTNVKFIQALDIISPRELVGRKIFFKKVMATNPTTKQEVESLRISKVE